MGWYEILILLLIAVPPAVFAVIVNRAHPQGRCIGCGRCDRDPEHRCVLSPDHPDNRRKPRNKR